MSGNSETLKHLINEGNCEISDEGHIVYSRSRFNSVVSNVVGAAAYYGKPKMLSWILQILSEPEYTNFKAKEPKDEVETEKLNFKPEWTGYTPLMLAIVSPNCDLECVKLLLANNVDYSAKDNQGNGILHIVAEKCQSDKVFEYLFKNIKGDVFDPNKHGDTPLILVKKQKNAKRIKIAEEVMAEFDQTGNEADKLLQDLMADEEKKEKERLKKKEKKHKS